MRHSGCSRQLWDANASLLFPGNNSDGDVPLAQTTSPGQVLSYKMLSNANRRMSATDSVWHSRNRISVNVVVETATSN